MDNNNQTPDPGMNPAPVTDSGMGAQVPADPMQPSMDQSQTSIPQDPMAGQGQTPVVDSQMGSVQEPVSAPDPVTSTMPEPSVSVPEPEVPVEPQDGNVGGGQMPPPNTPPMGV